MTKPLNEMDLPEVLEILSPAQKNSLLAYARQLARNTLSPNPSWFVDGRVQKPKDQASVPVAIRKTPPAADRKKAKRPKSKRITNHREINTEANLKTPQIVQGGLCSPR